MATFVHVTLGPSWERSTAPDDRRARWCFQCRAHLPHAWSLMDDPPERQPSYYDPVPTIHCSRCGEDHTVHPGSYRDGPAYPSDEVWATLVANAEPLPPVSSLEHCPATQPRVEPERACPATHDSEEEK